ncbi:alpha/beta hydrolase [Neolewinella antarctica]|uniref:Pimeloyl-ACP methyl ester carboxylesterase n=1 Tax=Neolewinella antarctica TaxID=442734 RepID=A0ABX0XD79_9BACT|nr:alpha/beta hydrolase [Neolewinella antarctica]NJC27250.1 pimeloyl-ACP methyl ester carboxylesterase [Neolewinella antarctica]
MKKRYWIPGAVVVVLAITYFTGPKLPEPVYDTALPRVPGNLAEIAQLVSEREAGQPIREGNNAHVRFHDSVPSKTEYAVIYLHGFGGSFGDAYPANYHLADGLEANIYVARWGAHGLEPPHSMVGFTAESAWAEAKEALTIGKAIGEKVVILSTSTGGTLALKLAAEFPQDVHALVNFSPNVKDDMPGAWLLGTPWGAEIAALVGMTDGLREVSYEEPGANQYFDTLFTTTALVHLQTLVASTMTEATFQKITCPVLTLYYYEDRLNEDERVEVDVYPKMHATFATAKAENVLKALPTPKTHFLGSEIMSGDTETPVREALRFLRGLE